MKITLPKFSTYSNSPTYANTDVRIQEPKQDRSILEVRKVMSKKSTPINIDIRETRINEAESINNKIPEIQNEGSGVRNSYLRDEERGQRVQSILTG